MRIRHKVNVSITEDTDGKNVLFGPDDSLAEVQIDTYERQTSGRLKILEGATENVPFGDVDAVKGIYLKVDNDCQVVLNGGVEVIQLRKVGTTSTTYAKLFMEADLTQVAIEAPADAVVTGTYCVWGDVTA